MSSPSTQRYYQYLIPLSMAFVLSFVGSSLLVNRIMYLGPFIVPGGMLIYPFVYFFGDIITEVYGYKISRNMLWWGLSAQLLFSIIMLLMIKIPQASFWHHQSAYETVFSPVPLYSLTCFLGTFVGGFVNIYIISKWKILLKGRFFWLRSIASTAVGESLFSVIALTPVFIVQATHLNHVFYIVISAYIVKFIFTIVSSVPATILVSMLKTAENCDAYDYNTNFNPFSLLIE